MYMRSLGSCIFWLRFSFGSTRESSAHRVCQGSFLRGAAGLARRRDHRSALPALEHGCEAVVATPIFVGTGLSMMRARLSPFPTQAHSKSP
eukprot:6155137-Prymnesium_polylepis.4